MPASTTQAFVHLLSKRHDIKRHSHPHIQLLVPAGGTSFVRLNRTQFSLQRPGGLLLQAGIEHSFFSHAPAEIFTIQLATSALMEAARPFGLKLFADGLGYQKLAAIPPLLLELVRTLSVETSATPMLRQLPYSHLCAVLAFRLQVETSREANAVSELVNRAQVLLSHADDLREVSQVSRILGTSERTLHREFIREVGVSPKAFQLKSRLEAAARQLESNDRPLKQIALDVGFADSPAFHRAFRKGMGRTPLEWRRAAKDRTR